MHRLTICALGPDDPQLLTRAAYAALTGGTPLLLRTRRHGVADFLTAQGKRFETLDALYDACEDFDELCTAAQERICAFARQSAHSVYAVSDPASDETVHALCRHLPEDIRLRVLTGVSLTDTALSAALHLCARTQDARTLSVLSLDTAQIDPLVPLVITEIDTRVLAGEAKLFLMRVYPDEASVYFLPHGAAEAVAMPLCEVDRQTDYGHTCALVVPPLPLEKRDRFVLRDLQDILRRLRGVGGCPWDRRQTHQSLRPFLIEEAYEACEAIDAQDPDRLCDELGDVLFQVAIHAAIGEEHADFTWDDVISAICSKMIERHEHVFGGKTLATAQEVSVNWEKIKRAQRGERTAAQAIRDMARTLPALMRAQKSVRKAQDAGYGLLPAHGDTPEERIGEELLALTARAQAQGVNAQLALEGALRRYVDALAEWEATQIQDEGE